jgi:hypothetical protein
MSILTLVWLNHKIFGASGDRKFYTIKGRLKEALQVRTAVAAEIDTRLGSAW